MRAQTVIVAGGYGCGSTHAYRIALTLLQAQGWRVHKFGANAEHYPTLELEHGRKYYVIKTHDAIVPPAEYIRVLLCVRDLHDAAASILRRAPEDAVLRGLAQRKRIERAYRGRADVLEIPYEAYYDRPSAKVAAIAEHLGIPASAALVGDITVRTGIRQTKQDQAELGGAVGSDELRPGQIGPNDGRPGAGRELSPAMKKKIEDAYANA